MKKTILTAIAISALLALLLAGMHIEVAEANFTPLPNLPTPIYVRGDGAIEGGAGALQRIENTYTFIRNINETIEIQKDNIIIDGNGFNITKPPEVNTEGLMTPIGWFPSIRVSNRDNVTIRNIKFDKCYTSISVDNSSNILIFQNIIRNGNEGIYMSSSTNCGIIGNEIVDNSFTGLDITGSSFLNITYNIISRNRWHGGWISVSYSNISRNEISDNSFDHFGIGLYLYGPNSYNYIFENNFVNNEIGLFYQGTLGSSVNNTVYNNYWSNYQDAIKNVAGDTISGIDQSPLARPISTIFEPSLFPLPSLNPTPSLSPSPSPTPTSTSFPSPSATPSIFPSNSPTQQSSIESTESPSSLGLGFTTPWENYIPAIIVAVIVSITIAGLAVYFTKSRKKKTAN